MVELLLPVTTRGRPTKLDLRLVFNAIVYLVRTGCQWRYLPKEYPKWQSVYYHFRKWSKEEIWGEINRLARHKEREKRGRSVEPTGVIIDSQSVKTTEVGGEKVYGFGSS